MVVSGVEVWSWERGKGRGAGSLRDSGELSDEHESNSKIFSTAPWGNRCSNNTF